MKLSIALVQLDATADVAANIEAAVALADEAADGARLVGGCCRVGPKAVTAIARAVARA